MPSLAPVRVFRPATRPTRKQVPRSWAPFTGMKLPREQRRLLEETARAVAGMMD